MKWLRPSLIAMAVSWRQSPCRRSRRPITRPSRRVASMRATARSCATGSSSSAFSAANAKSSVSGTVKVDGATVRTLPPADQISWNGDNGTLSGSVPGTPGESSTVTSKFKWLENTTLGGRAREDGEDRQVPGARRITIEKDGPATAYVGDQVTFTYTVTNTGNVTLVRPRRHRRQVQPGGEGAGRAELVRPRRRLGLHLHHDDPRGRGRLARQHGQACAEWSNPSGPDPDVCDEDTHTTVIPRPAIALEKTGAATAAAGSTYTYSFVATNTGNVTLTGGDAHRRALRRRRSSGAIRSPPTQTFDPGDAWRTRAPWSRPRARRRWTTSPRSAPTFDNGELDAGHGVRRGHAHVHGAARDPADNPPAASARARRRAAGSCPRRTSPGARSCAGRAAASARRSPRA